ncbi:MAG: right-handed parallel beta-helix repeat-containing protein [Candidatus Lokiarchaeota archaeon]|nr:right-handed parallel beta-helix repeat-containing protein [Candidatus Lokiarchaeota archaeon]
MFDVKDFGARGDGRANDAGSIDAAIAACAAAGGGTVHFPPGRYVAGTIHVKSNMTIDIPPGATVAIGDDDDIDMIEDLPYDPHADMETTYFNCALFRLDGVENVRIGGGGTIDGNRPHRHGPKPVSVKQCTNVSVRDINIVYAPNYAISCIDSEFLVVDGVWIENAFADGIDFDGCRFARVSNCRVNSADDAICLKSSPALREPMDCAHVTVTNCHVSTSCNCFKLGTESGPGGFSDVAISNCTFDKQPISRAPPGGICIESVDGAVIDRVAASNITMNNVACPIFIRLGKRGRAQRVPTPGKLENVSISNIVATNADMPCVVSGGPGYRVMNVSLDSISIAYGTGAKGHLQKLVDPIAIPEAEDAYPDPRMFGELPCWAFYCRHAENVRVTNMQSRIDSDLGRIKPAVVLDDVDGSDVRVNEYYF